MSTAALDDSTVFIKPSKSLLDYIRNLEDISSMPKGITNIRSKNKTNSTNSRPIEHKLLTTEDDYDCIQSLYTNRSSTTNFPANLQDDIKIKQYITNPEFLQEDVEGHIEQSVSTSLQEVENKETTTDLICNYQDHGVAKLLHLNCLQAATKEIDFHRHTPQDDEYDEDDLPDLTGNESHTQEGAVLTDIDCRSLKVDDINGTNLINSTNSNSKCAGDADDGNLLNLTDLHWLHSIISTSHQVYFHEIFEGSEIVLPKNKEVPRNQRLETRCAKLQAQQDNLMYKNMTKNVDCVRHNHPEDSMAFQMKQINTQLIAIVQLIVSVLVGFVFGFLGVELMIGELDLGVRLLLGIVCGLVIALAELYFLARKLNEDLEVEFGATAKVKVD